MKRWLIISISILIVGIGGFFLVNDMMKTGVPALDHDFTSEFIDEEADAGTEGFYLFESGTGQFQMHFPGEFEIQEGPYSIVENRFEISDAQKVTKYKDNGIMNSFQVRYRGDLNEERRKSQFKMLLDDFSYEGQYESFEAEDVYGFYGESTVELSETDRQITDPNNGTTNRYFAFIVDKYSDAFVRLTYTLVCENNPEKTCVIDEEENTSLFNHMYLII